MTILDQFRLDDRVAVVTGSGQGIGRAIAWALADAGCDVVVNARRVDDLEKKTDRRKASAPGPAPARRRPRHP